MTNTERETLEKDVVFEAEKAKRDYQEVRDKLAMMGEKLVTLGEALQRDPESVTPTPEIDGPDYREELRVPGADEIAKLCGEIRSLRQRMAVTAQRKSHFGF